MDFDEYKTLGSPREEIVFKDKNSKFYGFAYRVTSIDEVNLKIEEVKALHPSANHWCFAYKIGHSDTDIIHRTNDDGEPNNSAGMPIYGQILSFELTDILIVVVRYFGGTKLGVSGLINAYRTTAKMVLEHSKIITKRILKRYVLKFGYDDMNNVMRIIKEHQYRIVANESSMQCKLELVIRLSKVEEFKEAFKNLFKIQIEELKR